MPEPAAPQVTAPQVAETRALREQARTILEIHCGQCHLPYVGLALPGALAVFDLSEPDWAARMSDAQLQDASERLESDLSPSGEPLDVPDADQARFRDYVVALMAERNGASHARRTSSELQ